MPVDTVPAFAVSVAVAGRTERLVAHGAVLGLSPLSGLHAII